MSSEVSAVSMNLTASWAIFGGFSGSSYALTGKCQSKYGAWSAPTLVKYLPSRPVKYPSSSRRRCQEKWASKPSPPFWVTPWLCAYRPDQIEDREGQHRGVVT